MTDFASSILAIKSDAQVSTYGEDIDQITWHDGNPTNITNEEILAKQAELQAEYDAQEYARNRVSEYPTIAELTVALYDTDDKTAIETKRAAVKTKWPKDNSGPVED